MKDKHLHSAKDSALLKEIYKEVNENLVINERSFVMKIWVKFAVYFSLTLLSYAMLYQIANPIVFVLCFVIYGFISLLFAFNFSHDFSHNTIFKSKKLNNLCFTLIYAIVGAHAEAWKLRHVNSHHYAPNVEDYDSDLKISKIIRVIPNSEFYWYHRYQHWYALVAYTTYSLFWIFIKDFVILFSKDEYDSRKGFRYHLSFWLQKLFYVSITLVFPLLFTDQAWPMVLIGFFVMHMLQSLFLLLTFFMTHHVEGLVYPSTDENGYINSSWLMNQVKSSNDMHPFSKAANFILGGFNNHIAHHLFPHYHHIHYPKISIIIYKVLADHGVTPSSTTYLGGIVAHLRHLRKMGGG